MEVCVFDTCIHEVIFNLLIDISELASDAELLKYGSLLSLIFLLGQVGSDVEIFGL